MATRANHLRWAPLAASLVVFACTDDEASVQSPTSEPGSGGNSNASGGSGGAGTTGTGGTAGTGGTIGNGGAGGTSGVAGANAGGQNGGGGAAPIDAGSGDASNHDGGGGSDGGSGADSVWSDLSVMSVVNPKDYGAVGDGVADDLDALKVTAASLPSAGGIVYLPSGTYKKTDLWVITTQHVHVWSPDRQAVVFQSIGGQRRHQSMLCRADGCGFFGLKLRSDATERFDALEDNQISSDHRSLVEVVGCEIDGSAAAGIFLYGSTEHYIEGNYVHHTWADHIHHTEGARQSWVWNNFIFNEAPSNGDDGVACVTYGPASTKCGDMEWWRNTILHTGWGRGYSVIGGDTIDIHDNWAIGVAGAGIIVASEPSYNSASSNGIRIDNNDVYQCAHGIGHPGILVSGQNTAAAPLDDIALTNNVSVDTVSGQPYRAEGAYTNVTNVGLSSASADLPKPIPTIADVRLADTKVMRTRDVSHVAASYRSGLHRIHVREAPAGSGFQQRFEYVFKGSASDVAAFVTERKLAGDYLSDTRMVNGTAYALVLARDPFTLSANLSGVDFRSLRAGDKSGELRWLWQRLDSGAY